MSRFYIDTQTIPWEQISRPKVEAAVFRPQTKIYQAPRFNDMDKMRALQSRLIQNIYTRPLAVRQVTQENLKEKNSGIDKKMVTLRPRKRKMARGLQLDEKTTPIHQMRILKLRKEEERPRKLQAIKRKAEKIYRFCCALSALRARKHRVNQAHFAPRRRKAKKKI
jgi:hypothetical protein